MMTTNRNFLRNRDNGASARAKAYSLEWMRKAFLYVCVTILALCALRVFTIPVHAADDDNAYEEEYSNKKNSNDADNEDYGRIDVRLTRPGEAESRIDQENGYALVPGAERIISMNPVEDAFTKPAAVPVRSRGIASVKKNSEDDLIQPAKPMNSNRAPAPTATTAAVAPMTDVNSRYTDEPKPVKPGTFQEVSIIVSDYGYFPNRVFVTQNIPVRMYLTTPSKSTLCVMIDSWSVRKGVAPGKVEELNFTPDQPGNYRFYCPVKGIEGTITVRGAPGPGGEPSRSVATETASRNGDVEKVHVSSARDYLNSENQSWDKKDKGQAKSLKVLAEDDEE